MRSLAVEAHLGFGGLVLRSSDNGGVLLLARGGGAAHGHQPRAPDRGGVREEDLVRL